MIEKNVRLQGTVKADKYSNDGDESVLSKGSSQIKVTATRVRAIVEDTTVNIGGLLNEQSAYGTMVDGSLAEIGATFDGTRANSPDDPDAILGQSGGITGFAKTGTGRYTITVNPNIYSGSPIIAITNIGNPNLLSSFLFASENSLAISFNDIAGNPADTFFAARIFGLISVTGNSKFLPFDELPANVKL